MGVRTLTGGEGGSASVYGAFASAALLAVAAVILTLGAGVVARHRAQAAADLAALGAAMEMVGADPCGRAGLLAARNGARLIECIAEAGAVQVRVSVTRPGGRLLPGAPAEAVARAEVVAGE